MGAHIFRASQKQVRCHAQGKGPEEWAGQGMAEDKDQRKTAQLLIRLRRIVGSNPTRGAKFCCAIVARW